MSEQLPAHLHERLNRYGQQHLVRWWNELDTAAQRRLIEQIETIDFARIDRLFRQQHIAEDSDGGSPTANIRPASQVVRLPKEPREHADRAAAGKMGREALASGKVGAILVAGGQGERLGFNYPKGMYPIGPVSDRTLYQILAEQLLARSRECGKAIPYYVMTSDATHVETLEFFRKHKYIGLNATDVCVFRQGNMPAVDKQTGRILLAEKGAVAMSPDGHGGMLAALAASGCLDDMRLRGIEYLHYHQVDNPTTIVCDPAYIGFHILRRAEISTKVVAKRNASESMGVVVSSSGQTRIVEYIDMPNELKEATDSEDNLLHWAGNTAIHVFSRRFLDRLVAENLELPFHLSAKKVPFIDDAGRLVEPAEANAYKFERFVFDALPHASRALVVEADRAREFNPVKNADGDDSPATARGAMTRIYTDWLRAAGAIVPHGVPVEISPLFALDADGVRDKVPTGKKFDGPVVLK